MPDGRLDIDTLRDNGGLFAGAEEATATRLLRRSVTQSMPRGTVLFAMGEHAQFLYLLLAGSVALRGEVETGLATVVEIVPAGHAFLATAAILGMSYPLSAVALTDLRLLAIPSEALREAMRRDEGLARASLALMGAEWRLMVDQVLDLKLRPAEQRVARFLLRRATAEAEVAELPEPRGAIAARLGMTPETLSRSLAALEAKGFIRLSARRAELLNRARLLG